MFAKRGWEKLFVIDHATFFFILTVNHCGFSRSDLFVFFLYENHTNRTISVQRSRCFKPETSVRQVFSVKPLLQSEPMIMRTNANSNFFFFTPFPRKPHSIYWILYEAVCYELLRLTVQCGHCTGLKSRSCDKPIVYAYGIIKPNWVKKFSKTTYYYRFRVRNRCTLIDHSHDINVTVRDKEIRDYFWTPIKTNSRNMFFITFAVPKLIQKCVQRDCDFYTGSSKWTADKRGEHFEQFELFLS